MNTKVVLNIVLIAGTLIPGWSTPGQDLPNDQILAMGHTAWIAKAQAEQPNDADRLTDAEKHFAIALGIRNNQKIKESTNQKLLEEVVMWMANATKGASRVADSSLAGTGNEFLYTAKAHSACVIAMDNFIDNRPNATRIAQSDIWRAYRIGLAKHIQRERKITAYHDTQTGYSFKQHMLEYQSLGWFISHTMQTISKCSDDQKRHMYGWSVKMINLTLGQDPLPY